MALVVEAEALGKKTNKKINTKILTDKEEKIMSSREVMDKIRNLSTQEKRNLTYEALVKTIEPLTSDEIIELSNVIGYPVFTRLCMGVLKHRFVLLQDGAAAII